VKNRVPPPIWMLLAGGIMWLVSRSPVGFRVELPYTAEAGTVLIVLGIVFAASGIIQFSKLGTTVNPLDLSESTRLATQGIYRFTRNPMYLGLTTLLIGWGLHLDSPTNLLVLAAFVICAASSVKNMKRIAER
jgi:protein-S-isoprenylcysteine O-methyltransferase Ste14